MLPPLPPPEQVASSEQIYSPEPGSLPEQIFSPASSAEPVALSALPIGQRARIVGLGLSSDRLARLLEMGLTVGTPVEVIRFAPLGDPLEIEVRGYRLSLRKNDAQQIRVHPV